MLPAVAGVAAVSVLLLTFLVVHFLQPSITSTAPSSQPVQPAQAYSDLDAANKRSASAARPPRFAKIPDQTVDEGRPLQFDVTVLDRGIANSLYFSLCQAPPQQRQLIRAREDLPGCRQRGRGQAGCSRGKLPGTIRSPCRFGPPAGNLEDHATFHVIVRQLLRPPLIHFIPQQTVVVGEACQFTIGATSPAGPGGNLKFSLVAHPRGQKLTRSRAW